MTDSIADLLTRIRNAQMAGRKIVEIPFSKTKERIVQVMLKNNFLKKVEINEDGKFPVLVLTLLVDKKLTLTRKSKPGQRVYIKSTDIRKVLNGLGIAIVSTPKGVITGYEARALNVGGELLCEIS
jgi:small subunit ribosomal protein S8